MSYGINLLDPFRRAAGYVDRIPKRSQRQPSTRQIIT